MFGKKISVYVLIGGGRGEISFCRGFDTLNDD